MTDPTQSAGGGADNAPQPICGDRGAPVMGPRNLPLERANPDLLASPYTDAGTVPNLKFSYTTARNRLATGGLGAGGDGS